MSIVKTIKNKENPYAQINRKVFKDERLGLDEIGLLTYLIEKPESWNVSVIQLSRRFKCSSKKIYKILAVLIDCGYCYRHQIFGEKHRLGKMEYFIFENSLSSSEIQEMFPLTQKRRSGSPLSGKGKATDTLVSETLRNTCSVQEGVPLKSCDERINGIFMKKDSKGKDLKFDESEIFAFALKTHADWTSEEILYALDAAWKCKGPINSVTGFLEGTVKKLRNKKNFEKMEKAKCLKKTEKATKSTYCEEEKNPPVKSSAKPLDRTTLMQLFPGCC